MLIRVRLDLAFPITNQSQAEQLRDALIPFTQYAVVIKEGANNEERGFIDVEKCYHDESPTKPCEKVARWEVGKGKVI